MALFSARRQHGQFAVGKILPIILPLVLAAAGLFGGTLAAAEEGSYTPSITSDKADYAPGEIVTLTGAGWQSAEAVHVFVIGADPNGENWTYEADVVASEAGDFVVQFQLPDWFVANYSVAATGGSGSSATTDFTDSRTINSATLNGGSSVTVLPGASITAALNVTTDNGGGNQNWRATGWRIATTPGALTCANHADHDGSGSYVDTFSITAPMTNGTYNAYFVAYSDSACSNPQPSPTFTLTNSVVVKSTATLVVIKQVINNNGGTNVAADFALDAGGANDSPDNFPGAESPGTTVTLDAGSYGVTETGPAGYSGSTSADCSGTIAVGATKTCTVTNDDEPGTLVVIKHVTNDNGGSKTAANFSLTVTGANVQPGATFAGAESPGTTVTLNAGTYSVDEAAVAGYTKTLGTDCSGTIANGQTKTCTITNNDVAPSVTLDKVVVNDNGGTAAASSWTLTATGAGSSPTNLSGPGAAGSTDVQSDSTFKADTYTLAESGSVAGYLNGTTYSCVKNGGAAVETNSITLAVGDTATCTITNNDIQPKLVVIKHVTTDNGGTAAAGDFTMSVTGTSPSPASFAGAESPGTTVGLNAGAYSVTETGPTGYSSTSSTDCSGTIAIGQTKTCTVTNNDQPAHLVVIKHVVNDNGGTAAAADFTLDSGGTNDSPDNFAGAESPGTDVTLDAGSYAVTETGPSGYSTSLSADCSGTIGVGQTKTCTVTNDDQPGTLTVIKHVVNDNGGSKAAADFGLTVNGGSPSPASFAGSEAGTTVTLNAGSYSVDEAAVSGYSKSLGANCSGTIANGETKTCTITNDDQPGTLNVIKHVINDNGGTAVAADFTLDSGGTNDTPGNFAGAESPGTPVTLNAGTYAVTESGPSGYTAGFSTDCSGTIANGETKTCTVTNDDQPGKLIVIKHVTNDNGGTAAAAAFTLDASGINDSPDNFAGADSPGTTVILDAGSYNVTESGPSGYNASFSADCTGSIGVGETKTCTVTNDDIQPQLVVTKHVINDNGGTKAAGDFTMSVTGASATPASFPGSESGTTVSLNAGTYSVDEAAVAGYTKTLGTDCSGSITIGETKTCTVTNDDQPAHLFVIKHVVNDNGGTATAAAFTLDSGGTNDSPDNFAGAESPGTDVTLDAGSYAVTEAGPSGYAASLSAGCSGAIGNGETKTCTVTNDDIQPKLVVIKHVVNDNGGTATASGFTMSVSGSTPSPASFAGAEAPGTTVALNAGTYSVTESGPFGYAASLSDDCAGSIGVGETKTCTVTNDDIQPKLIVTKHVINDNGGTKAAADFSMSVTGSSPSPASFPGAESPGTTVGLNAGAYSVGEEGPTGYATSASADCIGSIAIGETKNCTVANDDIQPKLIVIKHVINDNGGTGAASAFTLDSGGTNDLPDNFAGAESPGTTVGLDAGSYGVTETGPGGYASSASADCTGSIGIGETKTCTITNDDIQPKLIVTKHVVNDNGGAKAASEFSMSVTGSSPSPANFSGAESPGTTVALNAGSYSVDEAAVSGYTKSLGANCSGSIAIGETKTCTVTNDDQPGTLIVIKHVTNDNGGTKLAADFTLDSGGTNDTPDNFAGAESTGTTVTLDAGSYSVTESGPTGYAASFSADCAGSIANGQTKTCTVTNNDVQPKLIVIKHVVNDNGGTKAASDFSMSVTGSSPSPANFSGAESPGTTVALNAGSYSVTETAPTGYASGASADCTGSIGIGETKTCTVTNDDIQPKLVVIKHVINDNGGTAVAGDFTMSVTGSSPSPASFAGAESPGTTVGLNASAYSVTESGLASYHSNFSAPCTGSIAIGETKTCTVTNDDNAPPVITNISGPGPLALGASATITVTFTDTDSTDMHTCKFGWDDGSSDTTVTAVGTGNGSCSATHTYAATGVYSVQITVRDDHTGVATGVQFVVVYDPNNGFVTGGGWINSLAGSYRLSPLLAGRANFGFVSKYQKGATVPTGETEFQFQVGNVNFHSDAYQWLVIAGTKAQYKGTGSLNGVSGYGFLLTATDGGGGAVDKFRIKIWKLSDGSIVYDNVYGVSDDIDAASPQALGGGSIVIHK